MKEIGAFEAKNNLGKLLDRVEHGEELIITRHGRPVAKLIPAVQGIDREQQTRAAVRRIRTRAESLSPEIFDWRKLKAARDHGRP